MKPSLEVSQKSPGSIDLYGDWTSFHWREMEEMVECLAMPKAHKLQICGQNIQALDTVGAYGISQLIRAFEKCNIGVSLTDFSKDLIERIQQAQDLPPPENDYKAPDFHVTHVVENLGRATEMLGTQCLSHINFLGLISLELWDTLKNPGRFRLKSFYKYLYETGYMALPIVGLISFLIGVVLVYQGANQLERFGAAIFTVNLLAISILRELGILLTAIVLAGRSGSAFTAQIGFMKLNQELDAMVVMNLNPIDLLIVPRILALVVGLPLLTVFSDLMGLLGGALMSMSLIDLSIDQFLQQLKLSIGPWTFWVGLIKAPFFAFVIAFVGCYEGLSVAGGAEEVGRRTTASVVKSVFFVIVLDAAFSILFAKLGV